MSAIAAEAPRRIRRPPTWAWVALWGVAILATYRVHPERLEGVWLVIGPVLLALTVAALRRLWERPPAEIMCGAIVLTIFSNGWSLIGLGGLPLNRLLLIVVAAQFLFGAPGMAAVPRARARNVHVLLALTMVYAVGSAAIAGTLTSTEGFPNLLDVFGLVPYLVFFLAPAIFAGQRERDLLLATLVGLGLYLGITGVFEALGPRSLVFPSYIVRSDAITPGLIQVSGPFQSPVAEGFATFACAVAASLAFSRWRDTRRRVLIAVCAATCLFACFATLERGVWIAAVFAAVITAAMTVRGRRRLIPGLLICGLAVVGVLAASSQLSSHTSERAEYQGSVWDRQNQTDAGLRMVAARPLLGFGWERYQPDSEPYFRQAATYPMTGHTEGTTIGLPPRVLPLHDTYLAYAVELGLVGFLLWIASLASVILGSTFVRGPSELRPWKLALVALSVFFLVVSFFDPHEQPFPMILLFMWAGIAYGNARPPAESVLAAGPAGAEIADPTPTPA